MIERPAVLPSRQSFTVLWFQCRRWISGFEVSSFEDALELASAEEAPLGMDRRTARLPIRWTSAVPKPLPYAHDGCPNCPRSCGQVWVAIIRDRTWHRACYVASASKLRADLALIQHVQRELEPRRHNATIDALPESIAKRISVSEETGCWNSCGARSGPNGYGQIGRSQNRRGAHRYVFETLVGPIPKGVVLRHECDNPACVNPAHLVPGTQKQNVDDMFERGRSWQQREAERKRKAKLDYERRKKRRLAARDR